MKNTVWAAATVAVALTSFALGAETRQSFAETYDSIADTILGSKNAEKGIVKSILHEHRAAARRAYKEGDHAAAAAEIALFGNEGDNRIGGIRKRLLEGGHHHNAEGEAKGIYEEGYVVVTRKVKKACLEAAANLQTATDDAGRQAAWESFVQVARPLLK